MPTAESWENEMTELVLYIDNDSKLYPQKKAIIANMKRKIEKGEYELELAVKGWLHWIDVGARHYCKEFKCELAGTFPLQVRQAVAKEIAEREFAAIKAGKYGELQKPAKKSKTTKRARKA